MMIFKRKESSRKSTYFAHTLQEIFYKYHMEDKNSSLMLLGTMPLPKGIQYSTNNFIIIIVVVTIINKRVSFPFDPQLLFVLNEQFNALSVFS